MLDALCDRLWPPVTAPPTPASTSRTAAPSPTSRRPLPFSDAEVIVRAHQARNGELFAALWSGNWQGRYGTQSDADLALCSLLNFWCESDPSRATIEQLDL